MIRGLVIPIIASISFASLAQQMWCSANKVANSCRAQEQVFKAAQQVFPFIHERQKEKIVSRFEQGVRVGAFVSGGASLFFAMKVLFRLI